MPIEQLTDTKFCEKLGLLCPYCRSDALDILLNKAATEEGTLFLPIKCEACGKKWNESYKLVGYEDCNEDGEYLQPQLH
jgi:formate dehydrogenase maturation protein FdhE